MKEVIAIIRPKKVEQTKNALDELGFAGITAVPVLGRGHQRGIASEIGYGISTELLARNRSAGMKYIPKRMLSVVVRDSDVDTVVDTIVKINQTANIGDGKIFVCPVDDAMRVRTDERGDPAII